MAFKDIERRREYNREYQRKWRAENPEKVAGYVAKGKDLEAGAAYMREWRKANPEKEKEYRATAKEKDPLASARRTAKSYQKHKARRQKGGRDAYHRKDELRRGLRLGAIEQLGGKCENCGEDCPPCLDFHHIDPSKKKDCIGTLIGGCYNQERIDAEVAKCVLLCRNCHAILHWGELVEVHDMLRKRREQNPTEGGQ